MDASTYTELRGQARALCRRAADVEDLVQETLIAGLAAGRADLPWLSGTLRNLAAMQARTAARRQRREAVAAEGTPAITEPVSLDSVPPYLPSAWSDWPPSLRRIAVLALHGLSAEEIRYLLDLTPEAFRQRISRLRKRLGALPPAEHAESIALAYVRDPARSVDLQFGRVRRALKAALLGRDGVGTHDVDGHRLVIRGRGHAWPSGGNG